MVAAPKSRYLVTGAAGQDGRYMVEALLAGGVHVQAMCRTTASAGAMAREFPGLAVSSVDLTDGDAVARLLDEVEPTHIINLAGSTSVEWSWKHPAASADILGIGPIHLLDGAWRLQERLGTEIRFLQASSAEVFGDADDTPQREGTPRLPVTPYGAAKAFADQMVSVYRTRGLFAASAILYNHESPRRPPSFVARKVSRGAASIGAGHSRELVLGNIDVYRDWGYAPDYVDAMLRIVAADEPEDTVVATGVSHSVREFVAHAFAHVGIEDWESFVRIDPALFRPADPRELVGDPARLTRLGWTPSIDFEQLVQLMVDTDLAALRDPRELPA